MRSFIIAALAGLAVAVPASSSSSSYAASSSSSAAPAASSSAAASSGSCMTESDAKEVAENFRAMINSTQFPTDLARKALAVGYQDWSDSVSELINAGCPIGPKTLGDVTFGNREAFIKAQSSQPGIPFDILNLWHNCDTVFMRWQSNTPDSNIPTPPVSQAQLVTGIVVMETEANPDSSSPQSRLITTTYSEFNSGAWLIDTGNVTSPSSCAAAKMRRSIPVHPAFNANRRYF